LNNYELYDNLTRPSPHREADARSQADRDDVPVFADKSLAAPRESGRAMGLSWGARHQVRFRRGATSAPNHARQGHPWLADLCRHPLDETSVADSAVFRLFAPSLYFAHPGPGGGRSPAGRRCCSQIGLRRLPPGRVATFVACRSAPRAMRGSSTTGRARITTAPWSGHRRDGAGRFQRPHPGAQERPVPASRTVVRHVQGCMRPRSSSTGYCCTARVRTWYLTVALRLAVGLRLWMKNLPSRLNIRLADADDCPGLGVLCSRVRSLKSPRGRVASPAPWRRSMMRSPFQS